MVRFVVWVLAIGILLAGRGQLFRATVWLGRTAGYAIQHDQMSYAKFTHSLIHAKPHPRPNQDK